MLYSYEIGKNIVLIRKTKHITQKQLADRAGISSSYLREVEHGRVNSSLNMLEHIADALNVHPLLLLLLSANRK